MDTMDLFMWNPPGAPLALRDVPRVILSTEVGDFGHAERFRPAFYGFRVLETWAWKGDPTRWYRARLAMFAVVLGAALFALWTLTPPLVAIGAFAMLNGAWYWSDIWARLGANEQYAAVGVALFAAGAALALRTEHSRTGLWLAAVGGVLAAWSKENVVVIAVPMLLLCWQLRRAHPVPATITALLVSSAAATVALELALASRYIKADIYGTPITWSVRLAWVRGPATLLVVGAWALLGILAWRAARLDRAAVGDGATAAETHRRAVVGLAWTLVMVSAIVVTQSVYYAPQWPRFGSRFDFPGRLLDVLVLVAGVAWLSAELRLQGRARAVPWVEGACAVLGLTLALRHHVVPVRAEAERVARDTQALRARLVAARDAVTADPGALLVLEAADDATFAEAGHSAIGLLAIVGYRGPIYLRRTVQGGATPADAPILERALRDGLRFAGGDVRPARELETQLATAGSRAIILRMDHYAVPAMRVP
jgi:hypothetical protein